MEQQYLFAFKAGLLTAPIGILSIGTIIIYLIREMFRSNKKYQPIRIATLIALTGAEGAYIIGLILDYQVVFHHNISFALPYIWTNVISKLAAAIALPVVFFYKVKD